MEILEKLKKNWLNINYPFLIHSKREIKFNEILDQETIDLNDVKCGDVVAIIGDFDPKSISTLLKLMEKKVIIVPLTIDTKPQHQFFFKTALVDFVIENNSLKRLQNKVKHELIDQIKKKKHSGLILFSTGTTGKPKAILHDLTLFMKRFNTPRPSLKTMSFLLFDHIGGINTLLHTLFNKGTVISTKSRKVDDVLNACEEYKIDVLPTTPTFLRLMLLSGQTLNNFPKSLKVITYGTERMDQPTLDTLCDLLPNVDFRQTYGMSEIGILRVKSEARNSLFMKLGGEGIKTRVVDNVLEIRSESRMLGYLNADSPFDNAGWYNTKDIVQQRDGYYKIVGRMSEVINVGGLKFMPSELEKIALQYENIEFVKAEGRPNPITGQHVELTIQVRNRSSLNLSKFKLFLKKHLPKHMIPMRIKKSEIRIGHRLKKN